MGTIMGALGFSKIRGIREIKDMVADVLEKPTHTFMRQYEKDKAIAVYHKKYGENVYSMVKAVIGDGGKDGPESNMRIIECRPYIESIYKLEVQDLEIQEFDASEFIYYVVCEHVETGMTIEFYLQNIIEYLDCLEDNITDYTGIRIVGTAKAGSIVLPIEKSQEDIEFEIKEREYLRKMLQRAKEGDKDAIELLQEEEDQMGDQLKERLHREDFLTVMDAYFHLDDFDEPHYSVLGTIKEIAIKENDKTKEKMYWMHVDINGMYIEVMINFEDLIGEPSVGMRFMGSCWLQGTIEFE